MYRCSRYYIYAQCTYTLVCITIKTQLIFQMKITSSRSLGGGRQMLHTYYREDAMGCSWCSSGYPVFQLKSYNLCNLEPRVQATPIFQDLFNKLVLKISQNYYYTSIQDLYYRYTYIYLYEKYIAHKIPSQLVKCLKMSRKCLKNVPIWTF